MSQCPDFIEIYAATLRIDSDALETDPSLILPFSRILCNQDGGKVARNSDRITKLAKTIRVL